MKYILYYNIYVYYNTNIFASLPARQFWTHLGSFCVYDQLWFGQATLLILSRFLQA